VGLFATITILAAALLGANVPLALATAPLMGSLLGFLRYNFSPASIFLGDSGSLVIGFLLGCYGVIWSHKCATILGMTAPLMAVAVPVLDAALSISRRFLRGQPIFRADRGHIHHRLLDRGLTPRRAALLLYGAGGLFAALSLMQSVFQNRFSGLILVLFCAAACIGVQRLGYAEFRVARRLLFPKTFQNMVNAQLTLGKLEQALARAATAEQAWAAVTEASGSFGFQHVEMRLAGREYFAETGSINGGGCWQLHIPLGGGDFARLSSAFHSSAPPAAVAQLAETLRAGLAGGAHLAAAKKPLAAAAGLGAEMESRLSASLPR